jgi:hypothetical protein
MTDLSAASAEPQETAHFRIVFAVQQLGAHLEEDSDFRLDFNKPRRAVVCFTRDNRQSGAAVCTATCITEIPATMAAKLATPFEDDVAALGSLSKAELAVLDDILNDLRSLLKSTIDVFRWRHGLADGPTNVAQDVEAFCSVDGNGWLKVSLVRGVHIQVGMAFKQSLRDVAPEEIVRLVESGKQEPVAHQLFREAWELRRSNPRSAVAIGIAAAEIGVKDLIATLVPNSHWLVKEMPSPSVVRILREYLPILPVRAHFKDKTLKPPAELITLINKGIKYRNDLVHAGADVPDWLELEHILRAVNDVLWICKLYAGEEWAGSYVSGETTRVWPASGRGAGGVTRS